jgi:hypothetical protein
MCEHELKFNYENLVQILLEELNEKCVLYNIIYSKI